MDVAERARIERERALLDDALAHGREVVGCLDALRAARGLPEAERRAVMRRLLARALYLVHRNDQLAEALRRAASRGER